MLPADFTNTHPLPFLPLVTAESIASSIASLAIHHHEHEITSAPFLHAQFIPSANFIVSSVDRRSLLLIGIIFASGATPAICMPLFLTAAAMPAQWVPWSSSYILLGDECVSVS